MKKKAADSIVIQLKKRRRQKKLHEQREAEFWYVIYCGAAGLLLEHEP